MQKTTEPWVTMVSKSSCWQPHNFSRMCSHLKIFNESLIPRLKLQCPTQDVRWYFVGGNKRGYSNTRLYSKRYGISAYRSYVPSQQTKPLSGIRSTLELLILTCLAFFQRRIFENILIIHTASIYVHHFNQRTSSTTKFRDSAKLSSFLKTFQYLIFFNSKR